VLAKAFDAIKEESPFPFPEGGFNYVITTFILAKELVINFVGTFLITNATQYNPPPQI